MVRQIFSILNPRKVLNSLSYFLKVAREVCETFNNKIEALDTFGNFIVQLLKTDFEKVV